MADLKEQVQLIYNWLQGTFDNNCQCQFEKEVQRSEGKEPEHDWVWTKFFAVNTPKFGSHVLFARQGFRTTGQVYRQRIYKFQINCEEGCVMNQIYKLKDESLFQRAEENPSSVAHLDPASDAQCLEGCDVYWKLLPEENRFHGTTKEGTCRFESKFFPGKTIIGSSDIYLNPNELWTQDRGVDTDGNKMYGFKSDEHHKFLRCVVYKGTAEYDGRIQEVTIHNQGEEVKLDDKYIVKLEQVIKIDTRSKVLSLCIYRHGQAQQEAIGRIISDWSVNVIGGEFGNIKVHMERNYNEQ